NIERYSINDSFEEFKRYILRFETSSVKIGLPLKAISLQYETKEFDLTKFENHNKNIDIHYIIEGTEQIGISLIEKLKSNVEYNEDGDFQLFEGNVEDKIILNPGEFLLLFPGEAHVTGGIAFGSAKIKKIVYK